jgi:hypothetical protein
MAKGKRKTYTIMARLVLDVDVEVSAESLDEALAKSKDLDVHDFADIKGGYNDGSMNITGVFEQCP